MGSIKFPNEIRTETISIPFSSYYNGICPFCSHTIYTIRTSRTRTVQDLGTPTLKRIVNLEVKGIRCEKCMNEFTPENQSFPQKYTVSRDVIMTALGTAFRFKQSTQDIALALRHNNNVNVSAERIQGWINDYSETWFQSYFQTHPTEDVHDFKVLTIDGTHLPAGKDTLGKKKNVQWSSVTRLKDNLFLLTWWE